MVNILNYARLWKSYVLKKPICSNYPLRIWIEVTNNCNLKCKFCPNKDIPKKNKGFMNFELFKEIINKIKGKTNSIAFHIGGEQLLHPQIFDMITFANNKLLTVLNANGTLLNENLIKKLINNQPSQIEFSLDTFNENHYKNDRQFNQKIYYLKK